MSSGRGRPGRTLMYQVGGGGEGSCRPAGEDRAEHSCTRLVVEGKAPVVRPGKTWQNTHVLGWWWRGRPLLAG